MHQTTLLNPEGKNLYSQDKEHHGEKKKKKQLKEIPHTQKNDSQGPKGHNNAWHKGCVCFGLPRLFVLLGCLCSSATFPPRKWARIPLQGVHSFAPAVLCKFYLLFSRSAKIIIWNACLFCCCFSVLLPPFLEDLSSAGPFLWPHWSSISFFSLSILHGG